MFKVGDLAVFVDIPNSCIVTYEGEDDNPFKLYWISYPDGTTGYIFSLDKLRHATSEEIAAGHRIDHVGDINDMGTDSYIVNYNTRL